MKRVEALIFDLDGTLVDSLGDLVSAVNHVLELRGKPALPKEKIRTFVGDGLPRLLGRALDTDDAALIRAAAGDFQAFYDKHLLDTTVLYGGVLETLDRFSSKQLAVISNKPEAFTVKILEGLKIADRFEIIWGPESEPQQKPDPTANLKAVGYFGVPPDEFCSIGDRSTDIEAGRAAGMMTVGVTYGIGNAEELKAARPDVLLSRITDLEKYVE